MPPTAAALSMNARNCWKPSTLHRNSCGVSLEARAEIMFSMSPRIGAVVRAQANDSSVPPPELATGLGAEAFLAVFFLRAFVATHPLRFRVEGAAQKELLYQACIKAKALKEAGVFEPHQLRLCAGL
jgi:hypothetical protein